MYCLRYSLRNHEVDQMILVCFIHSQPPERDSQDLNYSVCAYYSKSPDENQWQQILSPFPSSCPLKTDDFSDDALFFLRYNKFSPLLPKTARSDHRRAPNRKEVLPMPSWLVFALLSAISAALVSIFGKVGLAGLDSSAATAVRAVIMAIFLIGVMAAEGHTQALAPSLPTARRSSSSRSAASQARRRGSFTSWR